MFVDRTKAGSHTNTTVEGGPMPLPKARLPFTGIQLRVLIDHSLFEVFALGGKGRIASRVYPEDIENPRWALGLLGVVGSNAATVEASVDVWEMQTSWIQSDEQPLELNNQRP